MLLTSGPLAPGGPLFPGAPYNINNNTCKAIDPRLHQTTRKDMNLTVRKGSVKYSIPHKRIVQFAKLTQEPNVGVYM